MSINISYINNTFGYLEYTSKNDSDEDTFWSNSTGKNVTTDEPDKPNSMDSMTTSMVIFGVIMTLLFVLITKACFNLSDMNKRHKKERQNAVCRGDLLHNRYSDDFDFYDDYEFDFEGDHDQPEDRDFPEWMGRSVAKIPPAAAAHVAQGRRTPYQPPLRGLCTPQGNHQSSITAGYVQQTQQRNDHKLREFQAVSPRVPYSNKSPYGMPLAQVHNPGHWAGLGAKANDRQSQRSYNDYRFRRNQTHGANYRRTDGCFFNGNTDLMSSVDSGIGPPLLHTHQNKFRKY